MFSVPLVLVINFVWCNLIGSEGQELWGTGVMERQWWTPSSGIDPFTADSTPWIRLHCAKQHEFLQHSWHVVHMQMHLSSTRNLLGACSALVGDCFPAHFELRSTSSFAGSWTECGHTVNELHLMVDLTKWSQSAQFQSISVSRDSVKILFLARLDFCHRSPVPDSSAPVPRFPALRGCFCDGLADVGHGTWTNSRPDVWSQWWGGGTGNCLYRGGCTEILPLVADQSELFGLRRLHAIAVFQHISTWLVVWNMAFIFPIILGISYSQLTNSIIFQRGSNHQPATYFNHTWQRWATSTVGDAIPGRRCCCYMAVRRMRGLGSILASGKVDVLFWYI